MMLQMRATRGSFFFFLRSHGSCIVAALPILFHTGRCSSVNQGRDTLSKVYTGMVSQRGPMEKKC